MGISTTGRERTVTWTRLLAWLVLGLGLVVALASAAVRYSVVQDQETGRAEETAANVQTIVATQLARQDDLLDSMAGIVAAEPAMTNAEFLVWYRTARVAKRFPGGFGVSYIERVPGGSLAGFVARQGVDPVTGLTAEASYAVYPARDAEMYCLTRLGVWEVSEVNGFVIPAGLDYCAPELVPGTASAVPGVLVQATAEASPAIVPMDQLASGVLAEFLPVYAGGVVPVSPDERATAVVGWVAASFDSRRLVDLAVGGRSGLTVSVERSTPAGAEHIVAAGDAGGGALDVRTLPVSADGTWTVTVSQVKDQGSISPPGQAIIVLVGAALITLLVFLLIRVLGGSRERALVMVEEKTEQLEYQTLHDTLTGLPNRDLILDRASQMLARQERTGTAVAALFVDLDDFKAVNDRYGHAAGDAFLRSVAERIDSLFRGSDTVGRLGGDEFVVLLDGTSASDGAAAAAQRILDVLADPVELDGITVPVSCSVGVATGPRASADDLLRDADVAMYRAKVGGKGDYAVFSADRDGEATGGAGVRSGA